jgi:hypothetical protein
MNGVRRALVVFFGLMVAIAAGLIFLPIASMLDPATREAGAALAHFAFFSAAQSDLDQSSAFAAAELARFVWTAAFAVCVAPIAITVLIGESAGVRAFLWYVGATGLFAASVPWVARAALRTAKAVSASPEEMRFAFVFFLTGAFSGLVFWGLAGRDRRDRAVKPN